MSPIIYGPGGNAIVTTGDDVDKHKMELEVKKRVRSQAASMTSIWDRNRGKPKPTPVTWETLRLMGNRSEWVRAIIKTRKNQIGRKPWQIVPKDEDDKSASTEELCDRITKTFKRPMMYGSRPHSMPWRQWIGMLLEDLLVLDAMCIEKEWNGRGEVIAMYPVDGATIRPNIDETGGFYDDAYVQIVDGVVTARFGMEDLVYIMDNPLTDVRFAGYGMSPLENLIVSVTAELYSSKFNASYFEKGSVPEGMIDLGEDVAPEDVDAFRLYWMNEVMGRPWAIPIIGGSKAAQWIPWRENNRDMQFMEYQGWLLKKLCAVYQIAPQEIGELEDVNRSTADDQDTVNESKSIEPITSLVKDYFDVEIIGEHGMGFGDYVEFAWEEAGESAQEVNEKYQPMVSAGAAKRSEWREAQGLDTADEGDVGAEGLDMYLVDGEPKPLPTKEDAELLSTAKQQEREDQQAQDQQDAEGGGGQPSGMDWKPGSEDDPATRSAMRDHDDEHGIGARNKAPDFGKTVLPTSPESRYAHHTHVHLDKDVDKASPYSHDRNPRLTDRQDGLEGVFDEQRKALVRGLGDILDVPLDELEEAIAQR